MARRTITVFIDDLTNEEGAEEHVIGLDGELSRVDLTPDNFATLKAKLAPYMAAVQKDRQGKVYPPGSRQYGHRTLTRTHQPVKPKVKRAWWKNNEQRLIRDHGASAQFNDRGPFPRCVDQAWAEFEARGA